MIVWVVPINLPVILRGVPTDNIRCWHYFVGANGSEQKRGRTELLGVGD